MCILTCIDLDKWAAVAGAVALAGQCREMGTPVLAISVDPKNNFLNGIRITTRITFPSRVWGLIF